MGGSESVCRVALRSLPHVSFLISILPANDRILVWKKIDESTRERGIKACLLRSLLKCSPIVTIYTIGIKIMSCLRVSNRNIHTHKRPHNPGAFTRSLATAICRGSGWYSARNKFQAVIGEVVDLCRLRLKLRKILAPRIQPEINIISPPVVKSEKSGKKED